MYAWYAITNLGNISILLPFALLIALLLWLPSSTRRLCVVWLATVVVVETIVAATKVLYMGWRLGIASLDFTGLSGHATLSLLVWPVAFSLFLGHKDALLTLGVAFGFVLASVIAVSRLEIHAHSVAEVVFGGILGAAVSSLFLVRYRRLFHVVALPRWLAITLILPFAIGYGHAMRTESILEGVARILSGHSYVYTRADLHSATFHSPALCASLPKPHSPYGSDEADGSDMNMPRRPTRESDQELSSWPFRVATFEKFSDETSPRP
jgi:membrane-associated phospholipid phosphatase